MKVNKDYGKFLGNDSTDIGYNALNVVARLIEKDNRNEYVTKEMSNLGVGQEFPVINFRVRDTETSLTVEVGKELKTFRAKYFEYVVADIGIVFSVKDIVSFYSLFAM